MVLDEICVAPTGRLSIIPSLPNTMLSTASSFASMVITASLRQASDALATAFAPCAMGLSAFVRVRLYTLTSWPAFRSLAAIPAPIWPNPMKPIFMKIIPSVVHLSSPGSACPDTSEPDADREYDAAADDDLHDGAGKLAAHEAVTNEGDREELTYDHRISQLERDAQIRNQEREGMKHAAQTCGEARYCTTSQRAAASGDASVVGQRLRKPHTDGRAEGRRKSHKERAQGPTRQSCRGEDRCQRRHRAIHQSEQARLNLLQYKCLAAIIGQRCALDCHRAPSIMARCFARASGAPATDAFTSSRCDKKLSVNATAARATPIHGNSR